MSEGSPPERASEAANDVPARFEDALAELERVVERLERGNLGLDEALKEYERGVHLIRHCRNLLQNAEQRIELLIGVDKDGNPVTEPFVEEEMSLEEKREKRSRRRGAKGDVE